MFSLNSMKRIFSALLPSRRSTTPAQVAPYHLVFSIPARLLLSIAFNEDSTAYSEKKLIGSTHSISESGLTVIVTTLSAGTRSISEGDELRITLDLHPLGMVEMNCLVASLHEFKDGEGPGFLLSLKINTISANDQALYIEYLGTYGWEKVLAENGNS